MVLVKSGLVTCRSFAKSCSYSTYECIGLECRVHYLPIRLVIINLQAVFVGMLGLPLGLEAPVMTPNVAIFFLSSVFVGEAVICMRVAAVLHGSVWVDCTNSSCQAAVGLCWASFAYVSNVCWVCMPVFDQLACKYRHAEGQTTLMGTMCIICMC